MEFYYILSNIVKMEGKLARTELTICYIIKETTHYVKILLHMNLKYAIIILVNISINFQMNYIYKNRHKAKNLNRRKLKK